VDGRNGIFTHKTTGQPGMIDHVRGGMFDFDSVQELLHGRGKAPVESVEWLIYRMNCDALVCFIRCREHGIPSHLGAFQQAQHHITGRLHLITNILVPQTRCRFLSEESIQLRFISVAMDNMETRVT
jgi:hypothetical protein